jgi:YesN/AraC family two-component response regulator
MWPDGLSMIAALREMSTETPVIVVSGTGTVQHAVDSLRLGAWDYVIKLVENTKAFEVVIERALEKARLLKENRLYRSRAGVACFHLRLFWPRRFYEGIKGRMKQAETGHCLRWTSQLKSTSGRLW